MIIKSSTQLAGQPIYSLLSSPLVLVYTFNEKAFVTLDKFMLYAINHYWIHNYFFNNFLGLIDWVFKKYNRILTSSASPSVSLFLLLSSFKMKFQCTNFMKPLRCWLNQCLPAEKARESCFKYLQEFCDFRKRRAGYVLIEILFCEPYWNSDINWYVGILLLVRLFLWLDHRLIHIVVITYA